MIKLVVGGALMVVVSANALHMGLEEEVKRKFWDELDELVRDVPQSERLFIRGDFNGHIGFCFMDFICYVTKTHISCLHLPVMYGVTVFCP